jgi:hypothetical protein
MSPADLAQEGVADGVKPGLLSRRSHQEKGGKITIEAGEWDSKTGARGIKATRPIQAAGRQLGPKMVKICIKEAAGSCKERSQV